jgi:hypothetical protein
MNGRPREATLIMERRLNLGLSVREAARRAGKGVTEGSWRRTEGPGKKTRTPETVARMAQVVGLEPEDLEKTGRADAAAVLASLPPLSMPDADTPVTRGELRTAIAGILDELLGQRGLTGRQRRALLDQAMRDAGGDDDDDDDDSSDDS